MQRTQVSCLENMFDTLQQERVKNMIDQVTVGFQVACSKFSTLTPASAHFRANDIICSVARERCDKVKPSWPQISCYSQKNIWMFSQSCHIQATALFPYRSVHLAHCRSPDPSVFVYLWLQPEHPGQHPELKRKTHENRDLFRQNCTKRKYSRNYGLTWSYFMFLWFTSCKSWGAEGQSKCSSHMGQKNNTKVHKFHLNEPHR